MPTKTDHIFVLSEGADGSTLTLDADYDLTSVLDPSTERVTSALPDFKGRIWFVAKKTGKVGTLDPQTGQLKVRKLGEEIENSFAVGEDGVYIVSDKRMYRFKAGDSGRPRIIWQARYRNSGIVKPSQVDAGSGTTPTIMDNGYVAITDNADPMNVVVYRTAGKLRGKKRKVCEQPVFAKGASATENSLLTAGRSLIVENNYGYQDPFGPNSGAVTQPGFARVDVKRSGEGCKLRWTNKDVRAPTVVPKLSTKTGSDLRLRPSRRSVGPGLLLDGDRLAQRQDRLEPVRGLGAELQQQLRRARHRAERHGVSRGDRRHRRAPRRGLSRWPVGAPPRRIQAAQGPRRARVDAAPACRSGSALDPA